MPQSPEDIKMYGDRSGANAANAAFNVAQDLFAKQNSAGQATPEQKTAFAAAQAQFAGTPLAYGTANPGDAGFTQGTKPVTATADNRGLGGFTGVTDPNGTGVAVNPTGTPGQTGASAFNAAKQGLMAAQASGPAPQDSGDARAQVESFIPTATPPTFFKPTTAMPGFDPATVFDAQGKALSFDQYIAAGGKPDFSNVQAGLPPTQGAAAGTGAVGSAPGQMTSPFVDQMLAEDKGYQQLLKDQAEFNSVANQNKSLTETYTEFTKELGIPAMNTELMNMKNIIEGTEDDIRTEVTKTGGFATESQILALTGARNKQLIKNYNNLLNTKQMAMETLNTMVNLAGQDRQFALNTIQQKLQIDQQVIEHEQRMKDNARQGYQRIVDQVGYAGLAQMTNGDPYYTSLVEKTLGLGQGGLQQLAAYKKPLTEMEQLELDTNKFNLAQAKLEAPLDLKLKQEQIASAQRANRPQPKDIPTSIVDVNGKKILINSQTGETIKEIGGGDTASTPQQQAYAKDKIDSITNLLKSSGLNSSVGPNFLSRSTNFLTSGFGLDTKTGAKTKFIGDVQKIASQLTLDALINAKAQGATFGALSEGELNLLKNSGTAINSWAQKDKSGNVTSYNVSEKDFKAELDKINSFAKKDYILKGGNPEDIGVVTMPDGTLWNRNSDGSMTKL